MRAPCAAVRLSNPAADAIEGARPMRMNERPVVRLRWRRAAVMGLALGSPALRDARADGSGLEVRASSEVGAYSDSDHVAVLTPSVAGHVASLTAGWSVDG